MPRAGAPAVAGRAGLLVCASVLAACGSPKAPVFERESFGSTSTFSRSFAATGDQTCEAARRALLSQGYIVDTARADVVQGHKNFQPATEVHIQITFNIVCAPESLGGRSKTTLAFVNAVQDRYALKKSNNSASVGVGVLGSLSVPITASEDSLVKVASETITAADLYARLFALVDRYLVIGAGQAAEEPPPGQLLQPVLPVAPAGPGPGARSSPAPGTKPPAVPATVAEPASAAAVPLATPVPAPLLAVPLPPAPPPTPAPVAATAPVPVPAPAASAAPSAPALPPADAPASAPAR